MKHTDINIRFCRHLLKEVHADVKSHFPEINLHRDAWTGNAGGGLFEFHGPDKFYWHGRADNGWHARALGWSAWLNHALEEEATHLERQVEEARLMTFETCPRTGDQLWLATIRTGTGLFTAKVYKPTEEEARKHFERFCHTRIHGRAVVENIGPVVKHEEADSGAR
jgi:hypothetical protein